MITAVPEADRTGAFVGELRTLVKATYVIFARYDQNGIQSEIILAEDHGNPSRQTEWLQAERLLQSRSEGHIPRVTDAMIALDGMRGLVAVYGVDRTIFGMAIVARPRNFTGEERKQLEATLRSGSELMRRLSTFEGEQSAQERTAERASPAHFVLTRDYAVESKWIPDDDPNDVLQSILELAEDGLPPVVESAVRSMTAAWTSRLLLLGAVLLALATCGLDLGQHFGGYRMYSILSGSMSPGMPAAAQITKNQAQPVAAAMKPAPADR